ncbi:MAG: radical SAM protein [Oliverpabstia sp.]|nr:radical SAM protein [Oliverpabstia sp.]
MGNRNSYKLISVLDVTREEKRRRKLPNFGIMPIWRWLWCQFRKMELSMEFIDLEFDGQGKPAKSSTCFDVLLVYIEHYIPEWLSEFLIEMSNTKRNIPVYLCGFLPTVAPEKIREKFPMVKMVLSGPLEISLPEFCKILYSGLYDNFLCEQKYSEYPKEETLTGDDLIEYQKKFLLPSVGVIQTSSGCPRLCSFCRYSEFYHKYFPEIYRQYSMADVVTEIKKLYEDYKISSIRILDSNFLGAGKLVLKRADDFADAMRKSGVQITFAIHSRSDSVSEDVIKTLTAVGLKYVTIGIESMSDEQLRRFGKRETADVHWKAVGILKRNNLYVQGYGILADPLVTRNELLENLNGLYELSKEIQIVINERMILYTTTKYYRNYEKSIKNMRPIESSLGIVIEYDFFDDWCDKYFMYVEQVSVWLYERIMEKCRQIQSSTGKREEFMKYATMYRLEALIKIVNEDIPDDAFIEIIKEHTLEKIEGGIEI